ncbi:hypothetical protein TNIN_330941 [Trichonephila inaurata madagascariensis]|uniref:Uncharacterized protein n=1 Tax=Trichonephila inaurata madagascariensis TaxID=2747483 RepID=A0A8X6XGA1_9ARAC|nr:hypothetical protein TNIN_330941 [Trichonephila inaurata madagascariensis]
MFYASISIDGLTDRHIIRIGALTVRRYRDEFVQPIIVLYDAAIEDDVMLMDDSYKSHHANLVGKLPRNDNTSNSQSCEKILYFVFLNEQK